MNKTILKEKKQIKKTELKNSKKTVKNNVKNKTVKKEKKQVINKKLFNEFQKNYCDFINNIYLMIDKNNINTMSMEYYNLYHLLIKLIPEKNYYFGDFMIKKSITVNEIKTIIEFIKKHYNIVNEKNYNNFCKSKNDYNQFIKLMINNLNSIITE